MSIEESEMSKNLKDLYKRYKDLAFKVISKVPYKAVQDWKDLADGKVEQVLKEERSVRSSLADYYAITILSAIAGIISFWYLSLILGGVLALSLVMLAIAALALDPVIGGAIVIIGFILLAISPAISFLAYSAVVHVLAKALGGIGSFARTASVVSLCAGAGLVLMIPMYIAYALIIGLFISPLSYAISIFVLYLQYRGIRQVHGLSQKRAAAVVIIPALLFMVIYILGVLAFNIIRLLAVLTQQGG